ncbi:MAG: DUF3618 domain-containing protein [Propionibacteriaceae bacterium]|jgi:hypothetical protein|nr:DUF3618 domain-containing protein [Propionibacteriaceae bacterium]
MSERDSDQTAQLKANIDAARIRLAQGVQGLVSEVHPAAIKNTTADAVKAGIDARVTKAKALVVDDAGIRWDRIGTAAIVAVGAFAVFAVLKLFVRALRRS